MRARPMARPLRITPLRAAALGFVLLGACSPGSESGPVEVAWSRDACERCGMAVGEPRFAAQIRDSDHRAHHFDDLGCALLWLDQQDGEAPLEIWVGNAGAEGWLDARSAGYRAGQRTPMGYGFAAAEPAADTIALQEAWQQIRSMERERRRPSR